MSTEILRPNAAGDSTQFTPYGNSQNWDCVDEEVADDQTTMVYSDVADEKDLYNLPDSGVGAGAINKITVYWRIRRDGYNENRGYHGIKSGTTEDWGSENTYTGSWVDYSREFTTDPNTGSAWTWDAINALQVGVKCGPGADAGVRCTQIYVEVDYSPAATEKTSSDSGSGADAYVSLETPEAKTSSDTGSGVEGAPMQSAVLAGSETGSGIEAPVARLLAAVDIGTSTEVGGVLKNLFASELGRGSDSLIAKIETPTKGGGMKLWT